MQAHSDARYMVAIRRADGTVKEHLLVLGRFWQFASCWSPGVRKREALALRWDQIKEDRQVIEWVRNSRRKETKAIGGGQRVMVRVITEPLGAILAKLRAIRVVGNPYVFVGEDRRGHLKEITSLVSHSRGSPAGQTKMAIGQGFMICVISMVRCQQKKACTRSRSWH